MKVRPINEKRAENRRKGRENNSIRSEYARKHGGRALPIFIGTVEFAVIAAALRLGKNAYGASIRREIMSSTGDVCSTSAISASIGNLESKGFLECWMSAPTGERGGRTKRMVRVTRRGNRVARSFYDWVMKASRGTTWKTNAN